MSDTLLQILILVVGFFVLIKGADYFIDGAASIAKNLRIPDILVGLTIVAFGTSAPEAAVSIKAMLSQNSDMVLGNVVGSNILNILLIIGISAWIFPLKVKNNTIQKEIPFTFLVSLLLFVLLNDSVLGNGTMDMISRADGMVILIFFLVFFYYLITLAKNGEAEEVEAKYTLKQAILYTVLGLGCIVIGGNFVVEAASTIATNLGVGQKFISLTIVAFGTSLPELVTSVTAAKKQAQDIAIGNIIGSNIFNICFVVGLPSALLGNIIPAESVMVDLIVMLIATFMLFIFSKSDREVSKKEGCIFLIMCVVYYVYLISSQLNTVLI
ncbi:MAG: calcium/sodium antiporter [Cellulosilyticaceae bacterium]